MPRRPRPGWLRGLIEYVDRTRRGYWPIYVDYPVPSRRRYGWEHPPHAGLSHLLEGRRDAYAALMGELAGFASDLRGIPVEPLPSPSSTPCWNNSYVRDLDAATLYAFPSLFGSRRYVEVGSGDSTKFVRRGAEDHELDLHIVSIDPHPRSEVDELCDEAIRMPLEDVELGVFDALDAHDILMVDGSHRCFQNNDVTVTFLDILPRLRAGVLVYLDDIYLPCDYPAEWDRRYFSEQYLLAVLLMADRGRRYEVLLPGFFTQVDPFLRSGADRLWERIAVPGLTRSVPNGFWLRIRD